MTNTAVETEEVPIETLVEKAQALGLEHGKSSGAWVDGWTVETAQDCITKSDDGDPMWAEMWGAAPPFSGEWADGMTERGLVENELGIEWESCDEWEIEQITQAYEEGFYDGHDDEVLRQARIHAEPVED